MERFSRLYAKVCVDLAVKSQSLPNVHQDVLNLQLLFQKTQRVFQNSRLFNKNKLNDFYMMLIKYGQFNKITIDVLRLMSEYNHFVYMEGFIKNFIKLYHKIIGVVEAKIVLAENIDQKMSDQILELLAQKFKHQVILKKIIDPEILGGMRLEIESYVIDNTIANKLRRLKLEIIK